MELPLGFKDLSNNKCRLKKSFYRLKKSPRACFEIFTKSLKKYKFFQS